MKHTLLTLLLAAATTLAGAQDKQTQPEAGRAAPLSAALAPPVEGSTWVGTDSDGDYYEYTFVKGGQLRFHVRQGGKLVLHEDAGDYWAQNGNVILIVTSKFTTRQGLIKGTRMQGDAWNVRGDRWTWLGDKR